jgi:uncharacterized glyoxalase superfamily protein PhnB
MQTNVTPFLMFARKAEEAMNFYVSTIPNSKVLEVQRYGPAGPGAQGSVMMAKFVVGGLTIFCNDSTVSHAFRAGHAIGRPSGPSTTAHSKTCDCLCGARACPLVPRAQTPLSVPIDHHEAHRSS